MEETDEIRLDPHFWDWVEIKERIVFMKRSD
jgi:hypothetical protein